MSRIVLAAILMMATSSCVQFGNTNRIPTADRANIEKSPTTVDFDYMDLNTDPSMDFFQFANGTWLKNNPVPPSETRWSSFNELNENNNKILKELLEKASSGDHEKGSVEQLIGDFYFSYLDRDRRNELGTKPLEEFLEPLLKEPATSEKLPELIAYLHLNGIGAGFSFGAEQDLKINTKHAAYLGQGGLGLPNRDYYFDETEDRENVRKKYVEFIGKGMTTIHAMVQGDEKMPSSIFNMEHSLASAAMTPVEMRNIAAQYNKMTLSELQEMAPSFNWTVYFEEIGIETPDTIIVSQVDFIKNFERMIQERSKEEWSDYLIWCAVRGSASALNDEMDDLAFDFYRKTLRGSKEKQPDWKRAISSINGSILDEALGKAFVDVAFSETSRAKVDQMVDHLMESYEERIKDLGWMSKETKAMALTKLESFRRKLGYPDKWTDYSKLTIGGDNYFENVLACDAFAFRKNLDRLKEPIDKDRWAMPAHIVNAYYNPLQNEIVFPAGIMQPPFFIPEAEDAVNYARMGAVIGHELTHGFDDQGAQFTADGQFENWWKEEDLVQFRSRTQKLVNQYNSFEAMPGVFVNGQLTLGENIADFGGLTIAYYAYQRAKKKNRPEKEIKGYSPDQRFFIAFAQIWKMNMTEEELKNRVSNDPHSPGKYRVNGTLSNMPEFFEAFNIPEGSEMRQPKEAIAVIW